MAASYNILKLAPFNPILLRVVTAGGRRLRHAFTRWSYLALLVIVLLVALVFSSAGSSSLSDYAKAASNVFSWISYVQLGMICLLAPVFCASAITQERDSQTYNILLATPLSNAQIVLGSLLSRLYYVVALLLSGVPVFAITLLYGGVTASSIALSFAIALSTALFTGSLAIAIAVFRLGSGKTVFWFYVFNAIYLIALLLIDPLISADPITGLRHTTLLTGIHPFLALWSVVSPSSYQTPDLSTLAGHGRLVRWYFAYPAYAYVAITSTLSLAMVLPSAIVLRRIAQRTEFGLWTLLRHILFRGGEGRGRRARNVWANPVAWREAATRAGFSGRGLIRWMTIIVGLAAAVTLLALYYHGLELNGWTRVETARALLTGLVIIEFYVALLVAVSSAASAVTKERESQTLDLLLVTPITSRYYIWGKLRGLVSFMIPFAAVPMAQVLLVVCYDLIAGIHFAASGAPVLDSHGMILSTVTTFWGRALYAPWVVSWETAFTLPVYLTIVMACVCMMGLQMSLKWSKTLTAVIIMLLALMIAFGAMGACGFTVSGKIPIVGTAGALFSPVNAICILIDPEGFSVDFHGGGAFAGDYEVAGRVVIALMTLICAGLYCLAIWGMYKSMVKNFDMIIRRQHQ